eukprot:tig00020710_g13359.t1
MPSPRKTTRRTSSQAEPAASTAPSVPPKAAPELEDVLEAQDASGAPEASSASYYAVLGVPNFSTLSVVKAAYHRLCLKLHPDKAADPEDRAVQDRFEAIRVAYESLSETHRKSKYDSFLRRCGERGHFKFLEQTHPNLSKQCYLCGKYFAASELDYHKAKCPKSRLRRRKSGERDASAAAAAAAVAAPAAQPPAFRV